MPMPKAAVHLDYGGVSSQHNIRTSRKPSYMKAIPQPPAVQRTPKVQLGFGVFSPYPRHHPGSGYSVDNVDHSNFSWRPLMVCSNMVLAVRED